jgi:hypothetical protein
MKLGFRDGILYDDKRPNWDADGPRPISWSLWYPAVEEARESDTPERSWFQKAAVARSAHQAWSHPLPPRSSLAWNRRICRRARVAGATPGLSRICGTRR